RAFNPQVPPGLVVILNRMLAKRPEDRYATPKELLKHLEHPPSGPALSPRELLEALALDSSPRSKSPQRSKSASTKELPPDSTRLLGQPLLPGEVPKLHYRHQQIGDKK